MTGSSVIISSDLTEFFREEVLVARDNLGLDLSEQTEFYLVNLLCDFARRDDALPPPGEKPLAIIYKQALEAEAIDRIQILKHLGDLALYVSGFFAEWIERSLVGLDYYISMGGNAYSSLSDIVAGHNRGATYSRLYLQMARQFAMLVELLSEVADRSRCQADADRDLVKLYERWTRTGSDRIHKLLLEKGLVHRAKEPTEYDQ